MCNKNKEKGLKLTICCDKLWNKKRVEATRRTRHDEDDNPTEPGTRTGGGEEVPPVGGLVLGGEEEDGQDHQDDDQDQHDGCAIEKSEEVMKYRLHQYSENPSMELTGEDMMMAMDCDHCGPAVTEYVRMDCLGCGEGWVREDYTLCILGNDVISLFPSLDSVTTGKIIRGEVTRSTMTIEGFNTKLGLRYIAMNEKYTSDLEDLRCLLPWRMTKPGIKPSMKCKWVNSKEILSEEDWVYPPVTPTEEQRRKIIGHVAEIGTRTIFENFCYRFGGKAYHQLEGGPIGARVTMCAARMVMQHWAREYTGILIQAGLRIPLMTGYVDDGRQGSTTLRRGMKFDTEKRMFAYSKEQERIDEDDPDNVRMAKRCLPAMNAVTPT
jgi:hypothetical protein